ncbi:MAG: DUF2147 domain-containing protein [Pseudomonadota bacterium]
MRFALASAAAIGLAGPAFADNFDVYGLWLTAEETSHVEIYDCGDGTPCGRVAWIDPESLVAPDTPENVTDRNNPDQTLRGRPLIGLVMLDSFEKGRSRWKSGRIYDPEDGRSYGSRLKRLDNGRLEVKGCIGPICQTQVWTEAAAAPATGDS